MKRNKRSCIFENVQNNMYFRTEEVHSVFFIKMPIKVYVLFSAEFCLVLSAVSIQTDSLTSKI